MSAAPLRLSFDVACAPRHAFALWAQKTSLWWPSDHTVTGEAGLEIVFERRVGGRIFERTRSGREEDWGEITIWDPPRRLAYDWHLRADRSDATVVEIRFEATTEGATRIEIEHRGWERLGSRAGERREANQRGWSGLLAAYRAAASSAEHQTKGVP